MIKRKKNMFFNEEILNIILEISKNYVQDYNLNEHNKFVYENIIKWIFGQDFLINIYKTTKNKKGNLNSGIFICGPCGTGKSLIVKILKDFIIKYKQFFIINNKEFLPNYPIINSTEIVNNYINGKNIENYYKIPIICIDDIGAEPIEASFMGNKKNVIKEIIEYRSDHSLINIMTSNLSPYDIDFEEMYGERLTSRVKGLNYFVLKDKDYRYE